jgi:type IX secretion system PorP/SprF family membrane protein
MKLKLIFSLFLVGSVSFVSAQQDMLVTQFVFSKMSVNPAATGVDDGICATSLYRNQWDKVYGAPNSAIFNLDANLDAKISSGLGLAFSHDAIGFARQNNVLLNYAYHIPMNDVGKLSFGLGIGMINYGLNSANWITPSVPSNLDNSIPNGFNSTKLDANFGVYFKADRDYYLGVSSTHVNQTLLSQVVNNVTTTYQSRRHFYVMAGKTFRELGSGDLDVQGLYRTDMTKSSFDINARYIWKGILYGGLAYRMSDAVAVLIGYVPMKNMTIGYAYDITTNKLSSVSKGTHEIVLKYCFNLPSPPVTKSNHPRWL